MENSSTLLIAVDICTDGAGVVMGKIAGTLIGIEVVTPGCTRAIAFFIATHVKRVASMK